MSDSENLTRSEYKAVRDLLIDIMDIGDAYVSDVEKLIDEGFIDIDAVQQRLRGW